jgi:hypothetical protein
MSSFIPDAFIPFLNALTFTRPNAESPPLVCLWRDTPVVNADGGEHNIKACHLYLREETKVSLASVRQKMIHQLRENNHAATEQIADAFLGCIVAAVEGGDKRSAFWADTLQHFERSNVSHFFVMPNAAITRPITFDGYSLGPINIDILKSRCHRAGSDYAMLYASRLAGRLTLQSPEFIHTVADFIKPLMSRGLVVNENLGKFLLHYFECISSNHLEFMWKHLDRTQVLSAAFGAEILDVESFRSDMGRFADRATIYLDISSKRYGYVVPQGGMLILNQPGPDSEAYLRFQNHREAYQLSAISDSELGRVLFECGKFCQQASGFLKSGRADDAALYATICLEHVFSEKQSTSEAICSRTAVLTYLRLSLSYEDAVREMKRLYDARSGFVHAGRAVSSVNAERLIEYSREVLRSLLYLHLNPENRKPEFLKKWIKDLDFTIAGIESGKSWDNTFLAENGIFR